MIAGYDETAMLLIARDPLYSFSVLQKQFHLRITAVFTALCICIKVRVHRCSQWARLWQAFLCDICQQRCEMPGDRTSVR